MNSSDERARPIFHAALSFSDAASREEYLDLACKRDDALRSHVDSLLTAFHEVGDFMEVAALPSQKLSLEPEPTSESVDRYKLLQKIGEGGFGHVYMAEQQTPVVRRVALKIIKPGMDTKQVIARFEAERQALAMMDHPNIAKVLDAGQTGEGRPYFVMELVSGEPIIQYCDKQRHANEERLRLFLDVCSAIQHAHQKGIIHRDIKPSNILVTLHDGKPVPKVIDFGIAKATQQRLTDKTLFTRFEHFIGTPAYMSPEQAEMSGLDIDTRTDIYSLGVLLYELLTGQTPLDPTELAKAGFDEVRRQIRDVEPPTPSSKLSGLHQEQLTTAATNRGVEVSRIIAHLKLDLDWIVMKAMDKDRTRRYETANAFADDLTRYLRQEPVIAAPPSAIYRFSKFARRNMAVVCVVGLVTGILVAAASISIWQAVRANRFARQKAFSESQAIENLYVAEMNVAQVAVESGNMDRAKQILARYIPSAGQPDHRNFEWRYLWRQTHRELFSIQTNDALFDIDIAPSGKRFATGARRGRIRVWDTTTLEEVATFQIEEDASKHPRRYVFVAFSPDEQYLAGCSSGTRDVVLWDLQTKQEIKRFRAGGLVGLREVGFTPDGKHIFAGEGNSNDRIAPLDNSEEGKLWIWDVDSGEAKSYQQHGDSIWSADVSSDGRRIVTASIDGAVKILDLTTEDSRSLLGPSQNGMLRAKFSQDGQLVAAVPRLWGTATVWEAESGQQLKHMVLGEETINAEFSPDGSTLVISELRGAIHLIDTGSWETITTYYHDGYQQNMTGISPTGDLILSVGGNGKITGWSLQPDNEAKPLEFTWDSSRLKFSADGGLLAIGLTDGSIRVFDARTLKRQCSIPALVDPAKEDWSRFEFEFFSMRPDGRHVARLIDDDATVAEVWDLERKRVAFSLDHDRDVTLVTYAADGKIIATGTSVDARASSRIRFWDAATGRQVGLPIAQQAPIGRLAISSDSELVAVSMTEKIASTGVPSSMFGKADVRVYDRQTAQEVARLQGHSSEVGDIRSLEFSHEGNLLATAGYDRRVVLWDTTTWRQKADLLGHTSQLNDLSFSPDGTRLASSADDGWVRLWDLKTRREVSRFRGLHVEYSKDGETLAIGSSGGADLHHDHILGPDGSFVGFKKGSAFLTVRILRAPFPDVANGK